MELKCVFCKKQLCHQTADDPKIHGYYLYDDKAYCSACWTSGKPEEYVSCPNPGPELTA